jgi:hypothetical protein
LPYFVAGAGVVGASEAGGVTIIGIRAETT